MRISRLIRINAATAAFLFFLHVSSGGSTVLTNCTSSAVSAALQNGGIVTLACDGTLIFTNTIVISTNTTLDAGGRNVILSGDDAARLFEVRPNVLLTINGVSLRNGRDGGTNAPAGRPGRGGAIYNQGRLVLVDCHISGCAAIGGGGRDGVITDSSRAEDAENGGHAQGGAIYNDGGLVVLRNTVFFRNNTAGGPGGNGASNGLFGHGGDGGDGGNGGTGSGGAIFNARGIIEIFDCTFASNHVAGAVGGDGGVGAGVLGFDGATGRGGPGLGGAIFNRNGAVHIRNSSFAVNTCVGVAGFEGRPGRRNLEGEPGDDGSAALGGGIYTENGTIRSTNVTFSGNVLVSGDGAAGGRGGIDGFGGDGGEGGDGGSVLGGGIYSAGGTVEVINGTFSGSIMIPGEGGLPGEGGGFTGQTSSPGERGVVQGASVFNDGGVMLLRNTILGNSSEGGNAGGTISDGGNNLSRDSSAEFSASGSLNDIDPMLGSFDDHGGPTPTIDLLLTSPAIDSGNDAVAFQTDQRHARRNGRSDIGAFEFNGELPMAHLEARLEPSGRLVLSWPATETVILETAASLDQQWLPMTNSPARMGTLNALTLTVSNQGAFFRLRRP